jgi:hypothetical protein
MIATKGMRRSGRIAALLQRRSPVGGTGSDRLPEGDR